MVHQPGKGKKSGPSPAFNDYSVAADTGSLPKAEIPAFTQKVADSIEALSKKEGQPAKASVAVAERGFIIVQCNEAFSRKIASLPGVKRINPVAPRYPMNGHMCNPDGPK